MFPISCIVSLPPPADAGSGPIKVPCLPLSSPSTPVSCPHYSPEPSSTSHLAPPIHQSQKPVFFLFLEQHLALLTPWLFFALDFLGNSSAERSQGAEQEGCGRSEEQTLWELAGGPWMWGWEDVGGKRAHRYHKASTLNDHSMWHCELTTGQGLCQRRGQLVLHSLSLRSWWISKATSHTVEGSQMKYRWGHFLGEVKGEESLRRRD